MVFLPAVSQPAFASLQTARTHCVYERDPQSGLKTTHAEGLWPVGAGGRPLHSGAGPSQHRRSVNDRIASPSFLLELL